MENTTYNTSEKLHEQMIICTSCGNANIEFINLDKISLDNIFRKLKVFPGLELPAVRPSNKTRCKCPFCGSKWVINTTIT